MSDALNGGELGLSVTYAVQVSLAPRTLEPAIDVATLGQTVKIYSTCRE